MTWRIDIQCILICFDDYELFIATYGDTFISLTKISSRRYHKRTNVLHFPLRIWIFVFCFIKKKKNYIIFTNIFLGSHQNSLYFRNELYLTKSKNYFFFQIPNKYKINVFLAIINNYLIVHKLKLCLITPESFKIIDYYFCYINICIILLEEDELVFRQF